MSTNVAWVPVWGTRITSSMPIAVAPVLVSSPARVLGTEGIACDGGVLALRTYIHAGPTDAPDFIDDLLGHGS
jgi:hypothetical protein